MGITFDSTTPEVKDSIETTAKKVLQTLNSAAAGDVPSTRTISTTAPLTGGGDLSANRTLALTTSPVGQTPVGTTRAINTTAPITGGGDLSADRTLALTTSPAGQTPVGTTRTISTTAPVTGGGDLSADRTIAVTTGTTANTLATGNDSRFYNGAGAAKTIATGAIDLGATHDKIQFFALNGEGAAADSLTSITNGVTGDIVYVIRGNADITISQGGDMVTSGFTATVLTIGADVLLSGTLMLAMGICIDGTKWAFTQITASS